MITFLMDCAVDPKTADGNTNPSRSAGAENFGGFQPFDYSSPPEQQ
jgi:hypothetical protein